MWFGICNTCVGVWSNGVEQNKEPDEEHNEDWAVEGFQLARVTFDRDNEGDRETLDKGNCSINIWDGSELQLAWSKKSCSNFENNFQMFLLCGISKTSILKVSDVLHWVNFLVTKTFSDISVAPSVGAGNISFLISLYKRFPLRSQVHRKNYSFSIYRYHYGNTVLVFFCFFSSEKYHLLFFFVHFFNRMVKTKCKTSFGKLLKGYIQI